MDRQLVYPSRQYYCGCFSLCFRELLMSSHAHIPDKLFSHNKVDMTQLNDRKEWAKSKSGTPLLEAEGQIEPHHVTQLHVSCMHLRALCSVPADNPYHSILLICNRCMSWDLRQPFRRRHIHQIQIRTSFLCSIQILHRRYLSPRLWCKIILKAGLGCVVGSACTVENL